MRTSDREVYISIDVETDGPCPGIHSMLQLGAVAFDWEGRELSARSWNISPLPGASSEPSTLTWWMAPERIERFQAMSQGAMVPPQAVPAFNEWTRSFYKIPVAICYPSGFDFSWIHYYCYRFLGSTPFSFSRVIDIKAVAWTLLNTRDFSDTSKKAFPREWSRDAGDHTHRAEEDAREQGRIFFNILTWKQRQDEYQRLHEVRVAAMSDDHK